MGFKPMSYLQPWHNLRPPYFVFPDEEVASIFELCGANCDGHMQFLTSVIEYER